MLPVLHIGSLALQTPGLILLLGIWLGLSTAEKMAPRLRISANHIYNLVLVGFISGVLGARLAYGIQFFSIFLTEPFSLFSLTATMLNEEAGLAAGGIAALVYANRKKLALWPTLDTLAAGASVFAIAWHLANFASGNAFGAPTAVPWAIDLWAERRHPVQLYEMLAAIIIFVSLFPRKHTPSIPGLLFWSWIGYSALARVFLEFFHGDSATLFWNIHTAQLIAWSIAGIALWQIGIRHHTIPQQETMQPDIDPLP